MSLAIEIFKIGSEVVGHLLKIERTQRFEVSEHFGNLSRVFRAFPSAHRNKDADQLSFLIGKTTGLIESLEGTGIFSEILDEDKERKFFISIKKVVNLKDVMVAGKYKNEAAGYNEIMGIAGYFDGYSESLKAQAGKL
jgi:hypothetical protein